MSMATYRLEVSKNAEADELLVDVYNDEGIIEVAERVPYAEYALASVGETDETRSTETTADVTTLDIQVTRTEDAFEVRLLGDRERVATKRIADADWGLTTADA